MKRIAEKTLSSFLSLCLAAGACPALHTAAAAAEYEALAEWTFDSDTENWAKGGYWSSDVTGGEVSNEQGALRLTEDFTACTGTWNQTSVSVSAPGDYSEAVRMKFDYYTASAPKYLFTAIGGPVSAEKTDGTTGTWANAEDRALFDNIAADTGETMTIDGAEYAKYSVTLPLTDDSISYGYVSLTNKEVRAAAQNVLIGEIRTDGTYGGSAVYDNIRIEKAGAAAEPSASVTLDAGLAAYNETVTAAADGAESYQWYLAPSAAGAGEAIDGAATASYTPAMSDIGGWLYCAVTLNGESIQSERIRVAASKTVMKQTELPVGSTAIGDYDLALLNNTTDTYGKIDKTKWAAGGYIRIEFTGINDGEPSALPQLDMGTWSAERTTKDITAARHGVTEDGAVWTEYTYEDMLAGWYNDADFGDLKALRVKYSGSDKESLNIVRAAYIGYPVSYGELGTPVSLRGSYSGYQYLFTRHVGGDGFDAAQLREDGEFYLEYAEADADKTINLVAQCHSAKADGTDVKNTYAAVAPYETGRTGSGRYAKYSVAQIKDAFGARFRYIDGLRLAVSATLTANASLYLFEGEGALVDDISADGYTDAIDVPWTLYDDTAKDGIAVIGASITQNPLVTALAMSGKPFYSANGGWSPMLDRTDVVTYGIGSQTTDDIAARFHEVLDYDYKQIIIQCGNNDLGMFGDADAAAQHEYDNYVKMLDMVKAKNAELAAAGKPVILVHILAINPVKSEASNAKIEKVIEKLDTLEREYDFVTYVKEINGEFLDPETGFSKENLVMSDGLHPVAEGYAIYAKYLKPLLSKTSTADDATLASLSYRMSGDFDVNEAKKVVPGFVSGGTAAAEGYSVTLPAGTAADAAFRLYASAANIAADESDTSNAAVKINGTAVTNTDEYGNEYAEIALVNGKADAAVEVTSADGTAVQVYNISFEADTAEPSGYIYESAEEKTMNELRDGSWSAWVQYDVGYSGAVYSGAVIELDVTAENSDFTTLGLLFNNAWANLAGDAASGVTLNKADFADGKCHVSYTYEGTGMDSFASLQIKANENADYIGNITISNVKIKNGDAPEITYPLSADKAVYNTVISFPTEDGDTADYTYRWYKKALPGGEGTAIDGAEAREFTPSMSELGSYICCERSAGGVTQTSESVPVFAAGEKRRYTLLSKETSVEAGYGLLPETLLTSVHGGAFNPVTIKPYGSFRVSYTGEADIQLILSYYRSADDSKWVSISPSETGEGYAVFDFDACVNAYGQDFSDVEYINVTNTSQTDPVVITGIEWEGYPVSYGDLGEGISYVNAYKTNGIIGYLYTEHVGGEFRAQDIKEDSFFYLEYKGETDKALDLAFSSVSGALGGKTTYAVVSPSESGITGTGRYAKYTAADIRAQFGDNFARLDQINITTADQKLGAGAEPVYAENVTLYYFDGEGAAIERNPDDVSWTNKAKTGIAFIGDSIVQNPLVTDCALEPQYPAKGDWNAILGRSNVVNYGIGGETSVHISNRFYQLLDDGCDYDAFVMWFGVNDTGLVTGAEAHAERVTGNYKKMLDQVKAEGKNQRVYVLSILPTTPAFYEGTQDRIIATNAAIKAMCESDDYKDFVTYVDLYTAMLAPDGTFDCGEAHANPELFFDGLHPNGTGYGMVAEILNPILGGCYCDVRTDGNGEISYTSGYGESADYDQYVAVYDGGGRLLKVTANTAAGTITAPDAASVKAFFWADGMEPVCGSVETAVN